MSGPEQTKALMVGLPETGKTTFLAALWHLVCEPDVDTALRLKRMQGDRSYLNQIRSAWLSCDPLERTLVGDEQLVTLCLENRAETEVEVAIPDMSGETFQQQLNERQWSRSYDALVAEADGVLLFIHPDMIRSGHRLDVAKRMEEALPATGTPIAGDASDAPPERGVDWSPELVPTQVQLIELLQFLCDRRERDSVLDVAVVVSAWDVVSSVSEDKPVEMLRKQLPLLWQFLNANPETINHIVVGISAQGGDLHKDSGRLLGIRRPSKRIQVIGMECGQHDLTAPLSWMLDRRTKT